MNAQSSALVETPSASLARAVQPLEPSKAAIVREAFGAMVTQVEEWQTLARAMVVTSEDQGGKMRTARALRLEIRAARVDADKRRKAMKAGILLEGRAIDGVFAIIESLTVPLEEHLFEQETFAERAAKAREGQLAMARAQALTALGCLSVPGDIGTMAEETWERVHEDARLAKAAREQAAREAEEARVEAERILREKRAREKAEAAQREAERRVREEEQWAENARLRAEAEEREASARAERERVDAERRVEREAAAAAQRELEERARQEREAAEAQARAAREAAAEERRRSEQALAAAQADRDRVVEEARVAEERRKPTKAKYELLLRALRRIGTGDADPRAIAREALESVGDPGA